MFSLTREEKHADASFRQHCQHPRKHANERKIQRPAHAKSPPAILTCDGVGRHTRRFTDQRLFRVRSAGEAKRSIQIDLRIVLYLSLIHISLEFFAPLPRIAAKLQTLQDVGLGYVKLGQPSTTLSGGEAQRIKLATELSRKATGRTIYVLDEPTTGLHVADVEKLDQVLDRLAGAGNTLVVIEHNLDVIKTADYIIDMGPEGGDRGGTVIAEGTPEEVARCEGSYTGMFLKKVLN